MHILIEDYKYPLSSSSYFCKTDFMDELDSEFYTYKREGAGSDANTVAFNCVGYYFSKSLNDCVIVLPKVLIVDTDGQKRLFLSSGELTPEMVFDMDSSDNKYHQYNKNMLSPSVRRDLRIFGIWIYRALSNYYIDNPRSVIISKRTSLPTQKTDQKKTGSLLEVILELLKFNRDNRRYFSRVMSNLHSGSRIKWSKTIAKTMPIIRGGFPFYIDPIKRKALPNFEEELIVIYSSILQYITSEFGFPHNEIYGVKLIPLNVFDTYIAGRGILRLKSIRNSYFSDEALRLWDLCMAFFNELYSLRSYPIVQEHLLAKSFHHVFEDMVDFLIGQNIDNRFKTFKDGRQIDHIYRYNSIFGNHKCYYIGDSKYYPLKNENNNICVDLPQDSVHKQYAYAINVQQLLMEEMNDSETLFFDDDTEGYTFIPNFFISGSICRPGANGKIDYTFNYNDSGIDIIDKVDSREHFKDRLFDRSTLKLFYFNVNFMYVLKAYALRQRNWQEFVHDKIRNGIRYKLCKTYNFYSLEGNTSNIPTMPWDSYKNLVGKIINLNSKYYLSSTDEISDPNNSINKLLFNYGIKVVKENWNL